MSGAGVIRRLWRLFSLKMVERLFTEFIASEDTLQVYRGKELVFASSKDGLLPLLEYLSSPRPEEVTIFDKIVGNAAALLAVKAKSKEVYSPLGSELAIRTLESYKIRYHFERVIPYILKPDSKEMCPMEKLSLGKKPEEFYRALRELVLKGGDDG